MERDAAAAAAAAHADWVAILSGLPPGYALDCFAAPAPDPAAFAAEALALLADPKGEFGAGFADTWGKDLAVRAGLPGSVFAVVRHEGAIVAHTMVAYDPAATPSVGLVGHVYTHADHRRKGLSGAALRAALARHEEAGGRHWLLGTGSPGAAASYQKLGFGARSVSPARTQPDRLRWDLWRALTPPSPPVSVSGHLNGGLDSATKGYNNTDLGEWIMVRSTAEPHHSLYGGEVGQHFRVEPFQRHHWAAAVVNTMRLQ